MANPFAVEAQDLYLPEPPDDREKYEYFGKPRRWTWAWLLVASVGVLYGYIHVAEHAWAVSPLMWLLLMVMVPPVVVNFWLRTGHSRLTLAEHQATVTAYHEHGESIRCVPPQLRRAAGGAEQHFSVREQNAVARNQDGLCA